MLHECIACTTHACTTLLRAMQSEACRYSISASSALCSYITSDMARVTWFLLAAGRGLRSNNSGFWARWARCCTIRRSSIRRCIPSMYSSKAFLGYNTQTPRGSDFLGRKYGHCFGSCWHICMSSESLRSCSTSEVPENLSASSNASRACKIAGSDSSKDGAWWVEMDDIAMCNYMR